MTRKPTLVAVVAILAIGTPAALAVGAPPNATADAPAMQETTTPGANETTEADETAAETTTDFAEQEEEQEQEEEETTTAAPVEEPASVAFFNQTVGITYANATPQNTTVMVERAVLPEGGYVVIHAAENVSGEYQQAENVTIGPVLGNSTYLEPGDHANVVIQLDRPLNGSQTLVAMAHRDTNDNQMYDFPEADEPYTYIGSPVTQSGYAIVVDAEGEQVTGNETAGDEMTEDGAAETTTAA